jgi:hypothetical protein
MSPEATYYCALGGIDRRVAGSETNYATSTTFPLSIFHGPFWPWVASRRFAAHIGHGHKRAAPGSLNSKMENQKNKN